MRFARLFLLAIITIALLTPTAAGNDRRVRILSQGEVFCPSKTLLLGNVVVDEGRCFRLGILRERQGAFLALVDSVVAIRRNQPVFLDTPFGFKVRERIVVLAPIRMTRQIISIIPLNAIQLVPVRVEDLGTRLTIIFSRPSLVVVLTARP